jgi:tetratricopeptide (TPR) repeat protein
MYRKDKNAVVLYDPKEQGFTIGPISKFLSSLAEQKLIIDENVEYRGRPAHRVRSLMANQDVFVDPETFLPMAWAGLEISYENPPKGTFEIVIPDGYTVIDKRPGAESTDEPEWLKEYDAADVNFKQGIIALQKGEFEIAVLLFKHVVNNQPRRNWAWYWLGRAHYELGEYDLAIYEFTKTLEIVGSFSYCHYSRALAYLQKGMDHAAKEDLEKALPWMILALRYPEATTMFELADQPFGGKPYQMVKEEAQARMINHLRLATGQHFGYNPKVGTEENTPAIKAWEKWFENSY